MSWIMRMIKRFKDRKRLWLIKAGLIKQVPTTQGIQPPHIGHVDQSDDEFKS